MTQRSVIRAQSKLSRKLQDIRARGSRQKRHPWRYGGGEHPCSPPRVWGRSLSRSLLGCLRKDLALVSYCVLALENRNYP
jgi:hypothetical protein